MQIYGDGGEGGCWLAGQGRAMEAPLPPHPSPIPWAPLPTQVPIPWPLLDARARARVITHWVPGGPHATNVATPSHRLPNRGIPPPCFGQGGIGIGGGSLVFGGGTPKHLSWPPASSQPMYCQCPASLPPAPFSARALCKFL